MIADYVSPEHYREGQVREYWQEKLDGSQFSFAWDEHGTLHTKSRRQQSPTEGAFGATAAMLRDITPAGPEFVFRAELIARPKQNRLKYGSVPPSNVVVFEVECEGVAVPWVVAEALAEDRGLLFAAPVAFNCAAPSHLATRPSMLGGDVEGFVGKGGGPTVKWVTEAFREHSGPVRSQTESAAHQIGQSLGVNARYHKVVQHLREQGKLAGSPKDIGACMRELHAELDSEREHVAAALFDAYRKEVSRGIVAGFAGWYIDFLAKGDCE